jgi:hypothetical protein
VFHDPAGFGTSWYAKACGIMVVPPVALPLVVVLWLHGSTFEVGA